MQENIRQNFWTAKHGTVYMNKLTKSFWCKISHFIMSNATNVPANITAKYGNFKVLL
jgi:hypothetical protein